MLKNSENTTLRFLISCQTRYQYLWTYITSLHLDNSELLSNDIGEAEADLSFTNFVSRVLLLSNASSLEKFSLWLDSFGNIDIVKSWISTAIKRNVQKLEITCTEEINGPLQLPRTMFICKTLVDLTLDGTISLKVPALVWLPSFKILKLTYENADSAHKLIHGCPVLEYLDAHIDPWMPTLKRLVVAHRGHGYQFEVNTPKVEYLDLLYRWAKDFSLGNFPSLLEARIDIGLFGLRSIKSTNILKLLHEIANVKFLSFHADVLDYDPLTFHSLRNLTHLRLLGGIRGFNLNFLNDFIECSPNLEVLVLEGCEFSLTQFWSPPLRVPHCLLFHLKEVEYLDFGRESCHEFEVIECLLKNAEVLKKMTIRCRHSDTRRIAQFPRASKACKLYLLKA